MPVILRTPAEIDLWMSAPPEDALKLQRPLPDGALKIVAKGGRGTAVDGSMRGSVMAARLPGCLEFAGADTRHLRHPQ